MNSLKTPFVILSLFLMLGPLAGYSSAGIALINAKTGKVRHGPDSPWLSPFATHLASIDTKSHQFGTFWKKDDDTLVYAVYDEACRKLKEYTFPRPFGNSRGRGVVGSANRDWAAQDDKIVYTTLLRKTPPGTLQRDTPAGQIVHNDIIDLHIYDMAARKDNIIARNLPVYNSPSGWLIRWVSDTKVLLFDNGSPYGTDGKFLKPRPNGKLLIIDTVSGEQKTISNIINSDWPWAALSPDFTMLAFSEETKSATTIDKVIKIMNVDSGEIIKTMGAGFSTIGGGPWKHLYWSWSPDSKELAYAEGNQLKVHNIASGKERIIKTLPDDYIFDYRLIFGKNIIGYTAERRGDKLKNTGKTTLNFIKADTGEPMSKITLEFNGSIWLLDDDCTFACDIGY